MIPQKLAELGCTSVNQYTMYMGEPIYVCNGYYYPTICSGYKDAKKCKTLTDAQKWIANRKNNHGGARDGSGRKKVGDAVLYCKMPSASLERLKQRAKEQHQAVGTYLVNVLDL